jgi:hypothetical protein
VIPIVAFLKELFGTANGDYFDRILGHGMEVELAKKERNHHFSLDQIVKQLADSRLSQYQSR